MMLSYSKTMDNRKCISFIDMQGRYKRFQPRGHKIPNRSTFSEQIFKRDPSLQRNLIFSRVANLLVHSDISKTSFSF